MRWIKRNGALRQKGRAYTRVSTLQPRRWGTRPVTVIYALAFVATMTHRGTLLAQECGTTCVSTDPNVGGGTGGGTSRSPSGGANVDVSPPDRPTWPTVFDEQPELRTGVKVGGDVRRLPAPVDRAIPEKDALPHTPGLKGLAGTWAQEISRTQATVVSRALLGNIKPDLVKTGQDQEHPKDLLHQMSQWVSALKEWRWQDKSVQESLQTVHDDPVHPGTGEFFIRETDLALPGVGLNVELIRTYKSRSRDTSPLGYGWTHSYHQFLKTKTTACGDLRVEWKTGQGTSLVFEGSEENGWMAESKSPFKLKASSEDEFVITNSNGVRSTFEKSGQSLFVLTSIQDLNDNTIALSWENDSEATLPSARLRQITDTMGRQIDFHYENGFLTRVDVPLLGAELRYHVDENGDLVRFEDPDGTAFAFAYHTGETLASYVPSNELQDVCEACCGLNTRCSDTSLCQRAAKEREEQCFEGCFKPDACKTDCMSSCPEQCTSRSEACISTCADRCEPQCVQDGTDYCEDNVQPLCEDACGSYCEEQCSKHLGCDRVTCKTIPLVQWPPKQCFLNGKGSCEGSQCIDKAVHIDHEGVDTRSKWRCEGKECFECCLKGKKCPSGSHQRGKHCVKDCKNMFLYRSRSGSKTDVGCLGGLPGRCGTACQRSCTKTCAGGCIATCERTCESACTDKAYCQSQCAVPESLVSNCASTCVEECKNEHRTPEYTYGRPQDLNHNLIRITDGEGRVRLENKYGQDVESANFDRVVEQYFGEDRIEYHYFVLERGVPEAFGHMVNPLTVLPEICPSREPSKKATSATVIVDGAGLTWVFYADETGRVGKRVNHFTKANSKHQYDSLGRLVGTETQRGHRTCIEYDAEWNPVRVTELRKRQGAGIESDDSVIEHRFRYGPFGRLRTVFAPNRLSEVSLQVLYDDRGNLTEERHSTAPRPNGGPESLQFGVLEEGLFVDKTYAGEEHGTSLHPFRSIEAALAVAGPGDIIQIGPGFYPGWIQLRQPKVTIRGSIGANGEHLTTVGRIEVFTDEANIENLWIMGTLHVSGERNRVQGNLFDTVSAHSAVLDAARWNEFRFNRFMASNQSLVKMENGCVANIFRDNTFAVSNWVPAVYVKWTPPDRHTLCSDNAFHGNNFIEEGGGAKSVFFDDQVYWLEEARGTHSLDLSDNYFERDGRAQLLPSEWVCDDYEGALSGKSGYPPRVQLKNMSARPKPVGRQDIPTTLIERLFGIGDCVGTVGAQEDESCKNQYVIRHSVLSDGRRHETITESGSKVTIEYDDRSGAWSRITRTAGSQILERTAVRDPWGRVIELREEGGSIWQYQWSPGGRLEAERVTLDPEHHAAFTETTYAYGRAGELIRITGPETTTTLTRNGRGLLRGLTRAASDGETRSSCFRYDGRGKLTEFINPEGRGTRFLRDQNGEVEDVLQGSWPWTAEPWNAACVSSFTGEVQHERVLYLERSNTGLLLARHEAPDANDAYAETFRYDNFGRLVERNLSNGVRYRTGYNTSGEPIWQAVYHGGEHESLTGVLEEPRTTDPALASLTRAFYDGLGRTIETRELWFVDDENGRGMGGWLTWHSQFDDAENTVTFVDPVGVETRTVLDGFGRVKEKTVSGDLVTETVTYGPRGNSEVRHIAPSSSKSGSDKIQRTYTPWGALRAVTVSDQEVFRAEYDALGRQTRVIQRDLTQTWTYNGFGEWTTHHRERSDGTREPYEQVIRDKLGNVLELKNALHETQVVRQFDALGRLAYERLPLGHERVYRYEPGSHRVASIDGPGLHIRRYAYDAFGEVSSVEATDGPDRFTRLTFEHSALGTTSLSAQEGRDEQNVITENRIYDSRGQMVSSAMPGLWPEPWKLSHNPEGQVESMRHGPNHIRRGFDELGRLIGIVLDRDSIVSYRYRGAGEPTSIQWGHGFVEQKTYDEEGRVLSIRTENPSGVPVDQHQFFWDKNGTLARVDRQPNTKDAQTSLYLHDDFGRLIQSEDFAPSAELPTMVSGILERDQIKQTLAHIENAVTYGLDSADNWTHITGAHQSTTTHVGADGRYTDFEGLIEFDAAGRPVALPDGTTYAYNALGQLTSIAANGLQWSFRYDALGQLVEWKQGERTGAYRYLGARLVQERSSEAPSSRIHIPGRTFSPVASIQAGETWFLHKAWGDRLVLATHEDGNTIERYTYSAYGEPALFNADGEKQAASAWSPHPPLITGQPHFAALGLHRFGQRWYRPSWGRFLTPDPLDFIDGPNRYAYVGARPIMFIDPHGLAGAQLLDGIRNVGQGVFFQTTDLLGGALDGSIRPIPVGPQHGFVSTHGVGQIIGATFALGGDAAAMIFGQTTAGGGAALAVSIPGLGTLVGGSAAAAGAAVASAGAVAAAGFHGPRLIEGVRNAVHGNDTNKFSVKLSDRRQITQSGTAKQPNTANWELRSADGRIKMRGREVSGGTNPGRRLSFPEQQKVHTEGKILSKTANASQPGDVITIRGREPPCPMCGRAMNQAARERGIRIKYTDASGQVFWYPKQ